jgi:hypothetical protein
MSKHRVNNTKDHPVYEPPEPALKVLMKEMSVSAHGAKRALRALVKAGYIVAPMKPTNAMLDAYLCSYGQPPSTTHSVIIGVGKARIRWEAMATVGLKMAMCHTCVPEELKYLEKDPA